MVRATGAYEVFSSGFQRANALYLYSTGKIFYFIKRFFLVSPDIILKTDAY